TGAGTGFGWASVALGLKAMAVSGSGCTGVDVGADGADAGPGSGIGGIAVGADGTAMGTGSDFVANRTYSPAPLPATAAVISSTITMWRVLSGRLAVFLGVGPTGVSPN